MSLLLHELPRRSAETSPEATALVDGKRSLTYSQLQDALDAFAGGLLEAGIGRQDRVAIYLPKTLESVIAMFGAPTAGATFVPVNALLKPGQVGHILSDSGARVLVTSATRLAGLTEQLNALPHLEHVVLVDQPGDMTLASATLHEWDDFCAVSDKSAHQNIDVDMVSIFYTSGSTGKPKGVVLSHRNMVCGAISVATYLENTPEDRLLAVLPFSFDYGFSQTSTAFYAGATLVLMEYLLPRDVVRKVASERITGLAGVPPLWNQLAALDWPEGTETLRYFTNSGGAMPKATLSALRARAPQASPYLMYGLTEAFRSTYLPPEEVDNRPESMGKAIPNAEILVVNPDGSPCKPGETGELVHRGSLVSLGYWNNPEKTAERFKPLPTEEGGLVIPELAVWSGDSVRSDEDGFLYFVGRRDEMIKTSGYRVSPNEIEEVLYDAAVAEEAVAMGAPHPDLGEGIVVIVSPRPGEEGSTDAVLAACREQLANFMLPKHVAWMDKLPRNPNGKIDRKTLSDQFAGVFQEG